MFSTYAIFEVPDIKNILTLTGDYSWSGVRITQKANEWETFRNNSTLWDIVNSPTACYVEISEEEERIVFYRDQQDCLIWSVDPQTGKVYSDVQLEPVADNVEEFWFRMYTESLLWFMYAWHHQKGLPDDLILRKYAEFYASEKLDEEVGDSDSEECEPPSIKVQN
nr:MAG: hypothetical protein LCMAC202_05600 [Marseillevirus LCMAC202]